MFVARNNSLSFEPCVIQCSISVVFGIAGAVMVAGGGGGGVAGGGGVGGGGVDGGGVAVGLTNSSH